MSTLIYLYQKAIVFVKESHNLTLVEKNALNPTNKNSNKNDALYLFFFILVE